MCRVPMMATVPRRPIRIVLRMKWQQLKSCYSIDWTTIIGSRVSATSPVLIRIMKAMTSDAQTKLEISAIACHIPMNWWRRPRHRHTISRIVRWIFRLWWSPMQTSMSICSAAHNDASRNCIRDWDASQHRTRYGHKLECDFVDFLLCRSSRWKIEADRELVEKCGIYCTDHIKWMSCSVNRLTKINFGLTVVSTEICWIDCCCSVDGCLITVEVNCVS